MIFACLIFASSTFAQADSLSNYLQMAGENNPGLKADFLAYKASLEKVPQAGAYQDPELEMGFYLKPMDIIGGKQVAQFKLMQMFPWFGTKSSAQNEMTHMAKMAFEKFRESRDNLYLEVYTQWYLLCSLQQKLLNNQENKSLLTQLEELSIRKFSSPSKSSSSYSISAPVSTPQPSTTSSSSMGGMSMGGGAKTTALSSSSSQGMASMGGSAGGMSSMASAGSGMADVLRIQLEIAEIDNTIESLQSEIRAEKAKFNTLLNRDADSDLQIPDTFDKTDFIFDEKSIMADIETQNPMLTMLNEEGLAYKAKGEMDRRMGLPMFGVGVQYMLNSKTDMAMFAMGDMNGKDMIMPMVSVSIPIFRNKYKAQQNESKLWQESSREKYDNTRNALTAELYKTKHLLDDAERKVTLYKKQEELAQTTYNLVVQDFVTGKSDLTNVIQLERQLLDYKLKKAEATANYNTMVASIQRLISFENKEVENRLKRKK